MYEGALIADRYRLVSVIGRGSMGQVWRARDERLQRDVAIKLVDLSQSTEAVTPERFRRETIATARLNHPNIVTIFDAGTDDDLAYLVMELLPGRSLAQLLRAEGALPIGEASRVGALVARALEATHAIGVVHRDIKPANVMVDGKSVTLLDFGIAQLTTDASVNLTGPATAIGTAAYMSPEQALGGKAGPASDVYSLACVLMAMLTARPPFLGASSIEVAGKQINEAPPRASERRPDVPPALDDLIDRMLSKDAERRPTAREVASELLGGGTGPTTVLPTREPPTPASAPTAVLPGATAMLPGGTAAMPADQAAAPTAPAPASAVRMKDGDGGAHAWNDGRPRDRWFRAGVKWIVLAIVALLVLALLWGLGSQFINGLTGGSTASPRPSKTTSTTQPQNRTTAPQTRTTAPTTTAPSTTAPSLPSLPVPTISAPSLPSAGRAALQAATTAVGGTVDNVADSQARENLRKDWARARTRILEGRNGMAEVDRFRGRVDRERERGRLTLTESTALAVELTAVAQLL